jgi:hypothetical protein
MVATSTGSKLQLFQRWREWEYIYAIEAQMIVAWSLTRHVTVLGDINLDLHRSMDS